jgi:hypothetical protein
MWWVREIEARAIQLDFRSSGQGRRADTALFADGRRLVNAAGLVEVDPALDRASRSTALLRKCEWANLRPGTSRRALILSGSTVRARAFSLASG